MNADHLGDLAAPIHAARARSARGLALAQADDQLLTQLADRQGIDRVIDRLATDVGISEIGYVHTAQLAGNLLGRQTLTQHVGHQFEALATRQQLSHRSTNLAAGLHLLLGHAGRVAAAGLSIAAQLPADGRRRSGDQAGNPAQAQALGMTDLNGGAFFNAEFGIRHRGSTVPERSGVALSFRGRHFYWSRLSLQPSSNMQIYHDSLQELSRLKLNLRGGTKRKRSIPVAACNALVDYLHGVHKLIFVWSVATGLRIGALLNLKVIDFEQLCSEASDRFVFVLSKGGKTVHAYVPRLVIERTSRYVEIDRVLSQGREINSGRPREALFLNSTGSPVSYSCYYSAFKRACSAIKIKANPHQARNTFATVVERRISRSPAFKNLDSIKVMQGLLSHESSETTEGYLDSIVSNNSDVLALLEEMAGDVVGGV